MFFGEELYICLVTLVKKDIGIRHPVYDLD